jgi:glycosyltransferase involved in cell wall biosynthesis
MKVAWVTRSFLDYRVPVFEELNSLLDGKLALIYNASVVPERVQMKARNALGDRCIGLTGELHLGHKSFLNQGANQAIRVPWQPGLLHTLHRESPNVLISDGFFQWTAANIWMRMRRNVAHVVCYERTAHTERNAQWFRDCYRRWALRYVDSLCCTGRLCGQYAQHLGVAAQRITYGHMAADTARLASARSQVGANQIENLRQRLGVTGVCFLYVGRLVVEKGLRQLIHAWANSRCSSPAASSLLLVGNGPDRRLLEDLCRARDLQNVRFVGEVDYDLLAQYYGCGDVFVIPTLEDNWSLVVPEAMASGLPILCSKYNGCWPELVEEGRNGWIFDPLNVTDTASHLDQCISSRAELGAMGRESRFILKDHTPRKAAQAIFEACHLAQCARS